MRWTQLAVVAAALVATLPADAQVIADSQTIPVVARRSGLGDTQWVSDLTIHNVSAEQVVVGLQFFPADQANEYDPGFPNRVTLAARETLLIEDVLAAVFGYDTDVKGALLLTCDNEIIQSNPDECAILASTRTYNVGSPEGTYGQSVPDTDVVLNASALPSIVTGARNDDRFRSNLGIVNRSPVAVAIHYRILGGGEAAPVLAEGDRNLPSFTVKQWALSRLGIGAVDGPLTVEVSLHPEDVTPDPCAVEMPNLIIAYVSKVDGNPEGTGDAEFLYGAPVEPFDGCE